MDYRSKINCLGSTIGIIFYNYQVDIYLTTAGSMKDYAPCIKGKREYT
jgi:hypothetical protein